MLTTFFTPVLNPEILLDSLVTVQDDIRASLHPGFGTRAYRVYIVRRFWTPGTLPGESTYFDEESEISPQPLVKFWTGLRYDLEPCGRDEVSEIRVEQVSLKYQFGTLVGSPDMPRHEQVFIKLVEAHGQGQPARYFIHSKPPYPDRTKTNGWILTLRAAQA